MDFVFDLPITIVGIGIVFLLCCFGVAGLVLVRRRVLPRWQIKTEDSEYSGAMVQAIMVFYGLALALIAVTVWQNYSNVAGTISEEASRVAGLYRDVSAYPEPARSQMQQELRSYVDYVIHQAWPLQRKGQVPRGGVDGINRFQATLTAFEPTTEGQKILHAEALRAFNNLIEARRLRLDAVLTRLPGMLWFVIVAGALISLSSAFFFKVEDIRLHGVLVILLATFIGLVIFMVFALDRPFHGDLGLEPEPYQLIYEQLMKP